MLIHSDIPNDVVIHHTVLERMRHDPSYRPGNLIIGGGGRGTRKAPAEYGMGQWRVCREEGDIVGECWVRDTSTAKAPKEVDKVNGQFTGIMRLQS